MFVRDIKLTAIAGYIRIEDISLEFLPIKILTIKSGNIYINKRATNIQNKHIENAFRRIFFDDFIFFASELRGNITFEIANVPK